MAADLTLTLNGTPTAVYLGENTALARLWADEAAESAATALAVVGPNYPNTGAGLAATSVGESFVVDNGDGTGTVYLHEAGPVATFQRSFIIDPAGPEAAGLIGFLATWTGAITRSVADWFTDRPSLMDFIPLVERVKIRARVLSTTDHAPYIMAAMQGIPAGAEILAPCGLYTLLSGVTHAQSVTLVGDPGPDSLDDSWDYGMSGTVFHYRSATGDAWTFAPPDAIDRRIAVTLRDLVFRGSRVSDSGTSGSCVVVDGRNRDETFVRLNIENVTFCEAPHYGLYVSGLSYGNSLNHVSAHGCGYNGIAFVNGAGAVGETHMDQVRCFQCGHNAGGTQQQKACFLWLGGTLRAGLLSASESQNGPGAIFGGGPISIDFLQAEGDTDDDSVIIGQVDNGVASFVLSSYMIAPRDGYTHAHFRITQYVTGRVDLGTGYHADTLGVGGTHLTRDVGAKELSWGVDPNHFQVAPVIDDNAASHCTRFPLYVFLRDSAGLSNCTGDGTEVTWAPDTPVFDTWAAYSAGTFTAPLGGLYEFAPQILTSGIGAGHDRATLEFDATTYGRVFRIGRVENEVDENGQLTLDKTAVIAMKQGETCTVKFSVGDGGGAKTVDTVAAAPTFNSLAIRSVG